MKVNEWKEVENACCEDFESLFHYAYWNWDEEEKTFTFENEEEKPLKYCMFCGKKIIVTSTTR